METHYDNPTKRTDLIDDSGNVCLTLGVCACVCACIYVWERVCACEGVCVCAYVCMWERVVCEVVLVRKYVCERGRVGEGALVTVYVWVRERVWACGHALACVFSATTVSKTRCCRVTVTSYFIHVPEFLNKYYLLCKLTALHSTRYKGRGHCFSPQKNVVAKDEAQTHDLRLCCLSLYQLS